MYAIVCSFLSALICSLYPSPFSIPSITLSFSFKYRHTNTTISLVILCVEIGRYRRTLVVIWFVSVSFVIYAYGTQSATAEVVKKRKINKVSTAAQSTNGIYVPSGMGREGGRAMTNWRNWVEEMMCIHNSQCIWKTPTTLLLPTPIGFQVVFHPLEGVNFTVDLSQWLEFQKKSPDRDWFHELYSNTLRTWD